MRWIFFILLCMLALPQLAQERWYGAVLAVTDSTYNTRLFIRRPADQDPGNEFLAELSFRQMPEGRMIMRKEIRFDLRPGQMQSFGCSLPPGIYQPWVDVMAPDGSNRREVRLPDRYEVARAIDDRPEVVFSDIFLGFTPDPDQAFDNPLVDLRLDRARPQVFARLQLYSPRPLRLNYRAVLYQENPETSRGAAIAYVSLQVDRGALTAVGSGRYRLEAPVDLRNLPEGQYLLEVLVFDGSELLIKKEGRFSMGGVLRDRIYAGLPLSAEMCAYAFPASEIDRILAHDDEVVRREAFKQAWEELYPGEGEKQMEAYFRKVYAANERFAQGDSEGWRSDQGRTFILYGPPKEIEELTFQGKPAERWIYSQWALSFLFVTRNQSYELVE